MGGRVLRAHVDHDALVAAFGVLGNQAVPVLARDGIDVTLGRLAPDAVRVLGLAEVPGGGGLVVEVVCLGRRRRGWSPGCRGRAHE